VWHRENLSLSTEKPSFSCQTRADEIDGQDKDMDGLFVVLVILMTVIAYLVIRFIVFWKASRLGEDRQDQPNENQEHRQH
jgi:hypothetical protein